MSSLRRVASSVAALAFVLSAAGPAATGQTPRILMVGDSWGYGFPLLEAMLAERGHDDIGVLSVSYGGLSAAVLSRPTPAPFDLNDTARPPSLTDLTVALAANPTISVIHLNIGLNDLLGYPLAGSVADRMIFLDAIQAHIEAIVDHCLFVAPQVEILMPSYDYPNYPSFLGLPHCLAHAMALAALNATVADTNSMVTALEFRQRLIAESRFRVTHLDMLGLFQRKIGFSPLNIPAGSPLLPNPNLPSPAECMWDCFHPNDAGYLIRYEEAYDLFYGRRLGTGYPYMGSCEDFALRVSSTGRPWDERRFVKKVPDGSTLVFRAETPAGSLASGIPAVLVAPFDPYNPPGSSPIFPTVYIPLAQAIMPVWLNQPLFLGVGPLQIGTWHLPTGFSGLSMIVQGFASTIQAQNGAFAASPAHIIEIE